MFKITHVHDLDEDEDRLMGLAEQADLEFSETAIPGAFIVDVLYLCKSSHNCSSHSHSRDLFLVKHLPRWLSIVRPRKHS